MVLEELSVISVLLLDGRVSELPETVTVMMVEKFVVRGSVAVEFELTRQLARSDKRVGQLDRPSRVELQLASRTSLDRVSCFHVAILILNENFYKS